MEKKKLAILTRLLAVLFISYGLYCSYFLLTDYIAIGSYYLAIVPILYLVCGIGILCFKSWARKMLLLINIPFPLFFYIVNKGYVYGPISWGRIAILLTWFVFIITAINQVFFTRPKIKEQFR